MLIVAIRPPIKLFFQLSVRPIHRPTGKKENIMISFFDVKEEAWSLKNSPAKNIPIMNRENMLNPFAVYSMVLLSAIKYL